MRKFIIQLLLTSVSQSHLEFICCVVVFKVSLFVAWYRITKTDLIFFLRKMAVAKSSSFLRVCGFAKLILFHFLRIIFILLVFRDKRNFDSIWNFGGTFRNITEISSHLGRLGSLRLEWKFVTSNENDIPLIQKINMRPNTSLRH